MNVKRRIMFGMALVLTAWMTACAGAGDPPAAQTSPLAGSEWVLESLNGETSIEGKAITLRFEETSIEGSGGCNTYGGSYTASEDNLSLSDLYWTEIGCPEPEGILEQEQVYFQALDAAARYRMDGDRLELYDESGAQRLAFVVEGSASSAQVTLEPPQGTAVTQTAPTAEPPTPVPPMPTAEATETPEPPAFEPPAGFVKYEDSSTGISVYIPDGWVVTGVIPGEWAILQSYPEDKYVGGGGQHPGDTKCDLVIRPPGVSVVDAIQASRSDSLATIVSEQEIVLQSGQPGIRVEVESMGLSVSLFTEINERTVVLTCFGEFEPFDQIAVTLSGNE